MAKMVGYRHLTRKNQMDLAKLVRDLKHNEKVRLDVGRMLAGYIEQIDAFFDRKTFMGIVTSKLSGDSRTDWCSELTKEQDDAKV